MGSIVASVIAPRLRSTATALSNAAAIAGSGLAIPAPKLLTTPMRRPRTPCESRGRHAVVPSASNTIARSSTVQAKGPGTSIDQQFGRIPAVLRSPWVGFMPTTPVAAAGSRTDPVVSEPMVNKASPQATATPAPVDDPPEKWAKFQGFRAGGNGRSKYFPPLPGPYSQVLGFPT